MATAKNDITTVRLDKPMRELLKAAAETQDGVRQADIIREALRCYFAELILGNKEFAGLAHDIGQLAVEEARAEVYARLGLPATQVSGYPSEQREPSQIKPSETVA